MIKALATEQLDAVDSDDHEGTALTLKRLGVNPSRDKTGKPTVAPNAKDIKPADKDESNEGNAQCVTY